MFPYDVHHVSCQPSPTYAMFPVTTVRHVCCQPSTTAIFTASVRHVSCRRQRRPPCFPRFGVFPVTPSAMFAVNRKRPPYSLRASDMFPADGHDVRHVSRGRPPCFLLTVTDVRHVSSRCSLTCVMLPADVHRCPPYFRPPAAMVPPWFLPVAGTVVVQANSPRSHFQASSRCHSALQLYQRYPLLPVLSSFSIFLLIISHPLYVLLRANISILLELWSTSSSIHYTRFLRDNRRKMFIMSHLMLVWKHKISTRMNKINNVTHKTNCTRLERLQLLAWSCRN